MIDLERELNRTHAALDQERGVNDLHRQDMKAILREAREDRDEIKQLRRRLDRALSALRSYDTALADHIEKLP